MRILPWATMLFSAHKHLRLILINTIAAISNYSYMASIYRLQDSVHG